ncbi:MAG: ATP synthase F1 subunit delta [candidate division KSB1 bacterium]|nr:ATP synthase F1 subunit delta [candidate division KSB1 bacterium]
MRAIALARRYARALLQAARSQGRAEEIAQELSLFLSVLEQEGKFRLLLLSPEVDRARKQELIDRVAQGWLSELFVRFLRVLIEARREAFLPEIRVQYERLLDQELGRVEAEAITAVPMDEPERESLQRRLSEALRSEVKLRSRVDQEILGGLVLRIDGKVFDASLRRRLERLRAELLAARLPVEVNAEVRNAD